jgi:hypothetical protein
MITLVFEHNVIFFNVVHFLQINSESLLVVSRNVILISEIYQVNLIDAYYWCGE